MKINKAKLGLKGITIEFRSSDNVRLGDIFEIKVSRSEYYFKVQGISASTGDPRLLVEAVECGYFVDLYSKFPNCDIREICKCTPIIITDPEKVKKIQEWSRYC